MVVVAVVVFSQGARNSFSTVTSTEKKVGAFREVAVRCRQRRSAMGKARAAVDFGRTGSVNWQFKRWRGYHEEVCVLVMWHQRMSTRSPLAAEARAARETHVGHCTFNLLRPLLRRLCCIYKHASLRDASRLLMRSVL